MEKGERILVNAERWEELTDMYSAQRLAESPPKAGEPPSIRAATHEGHLYTTFSVYYGPWGREWKPVIPAYRLLPEQLFEGETTTVYHDEDAIAAGLRKRGDHTGLIVSYRRQRLVCAERVNLVMDLPKHRLDLASAQAYDEQNRACGWRSLLYNSNTTGWFSYKGHPVAQYRHNGETANVLLYKCQGRIRDLRLLPCVDVEPIELLSTQAARPKMIENQMGLF